MFNVSDILASEGLSWEVESGVTLHLLENNPKDKIFTSNEKKIADLLKEISALEIETLRGITPESWNRKSEIDVVREIFDTGNFAILATVKGKAVGIATVASWFQHTDLGSNINNLIIDNKYRGRGIGEAILNKVLDVAKEREFESIGLGHNALNYKAAKLYERLGFKPIYVSRELVLRR